MLSKFRRSSKDTYNIVTGDESWIYHFDPKTKEQLRVWWNTTQCLSKDIKEGKKQQPRLKKGHLLLYHENALAHRVATKVNFFFQQKTCKFYLTQLVLLTWKTVTTSFPPKAKETPCGCQFSPICLL